MEYVEIVIHVQLNGRSGLLQTIDVEDLLKKLDSESAIVRMEEKHDNNYGKFVEVD